MSGLYAPAHGGYPSARRRRRSVGVNIQMHHPLGPDLGGFGGPGTAAAAAAMQLDRRRISARER